MPGNRSIFASNRERHLWYWTIVVVLAIYSTLGPAKDIADALREHDVLEASVIIAIVLVLGSLLMFWVRKRPGWRDVGAIMAVLFAFFMVGVRVNSWEERTHLIEYGIVAALVHQALLERARGDREVYQPALLTITITAFLGVIDEVIQLFIPGRFFDPRDIFFNAIAGFMVVAARLAIAPQNQPGWRVWFLWLMATAYGWGWGVYWGWFDGTEPKTLQSVPAEMMAGYMGLCGAGILMGVLQWGVLRTHIKRAIRWPMCNGVAVLIAGCVIFGAGAIDKNLGWFLGISSFGTVLGVLQWLLLRDQVSRAGWWVLASSLGWGIGMPIGDIVGPPGLGAVYGMLTGVVLVWLLRNKLIIEND